MSKSASHVPLLLLLFWTALVLMADGVFVATAWRQHRAASFPSVTVKIAQSGLGQGPLGRRGLRLRYTYSVNNVNYSGFRYRYDEADAGLAYDKVVQEYPAHTVHKAYYNPADPRDSILAPGVDGADLLLILMATPITIGTGGFWFAFLDHRRRRDPPADQKRFEILQNANQIRVRLADTSAIAVGLFGFALACALAVSIVIFICGLEESIPLVASLWAFSGAAGLACAAWQDSRNRSGRFDLCFDERGGDLILPLTGGRRAPVILPRRELLGVAISRRVSKMPSGNHFSYVPTLTLAGGGTAALVNFGWTQRRAVAFGQWLSDLLHAEFQGVSDEAASTARQPATASTSGAAVQ